MAKPTIRFKGFDDEWEQRKFGEITELKSASRVHKDEWTSNGVPFYRSSDVMAAINGTENEKAFISEELYEKLSKVSGKLEEGDILVTGGGSVGNPYIVPDNKPLYTKDADLLWIKNKGKFHPYFLYEFFFSPTFRNYLGSISHVGTIAHYTITQLSDTPICLPSFDEQKEVGEYFQSLDNLITLHQRKCDETKKLKKYMLQKMFPQNGSKVPEIRFKGFTDEWEQRKFGEITELKSASRVHKDEWTSNGVPFYRSSDVMAAINGTENEKAFISEELYEKLSKVSGKLEEGDILVTGGGSVGNPYIVPDNKPLYTKDADLLWIKNKGKFHPYFLYEFFFSPTFRNYLGSISHVGTIAHYTITQLSDTPICLPSFDEQKEVGEYFQSLDNLITLHQRKCDETKKLKKYMLQKMFPQNGSKVPEIRFKGFTDEWEQRKLSEIALQTYGGGTPKTANEEFWKGNIPWIQSSDLIEERLFNVKPRKYISQEAISKSATKLVPQNSIAIVTRVGVGKLAFMPFSYATSQDFLSLSELKIEPEFAVYALYKMMQLVSNEVQGTSIKGITKDELLAKEILIPDCEEQKKIGAYLHTLDSLITLHQHKCEELKKLKKFMLQNMFTQKNK